jgi:hypothetical protein
MEITGDWRKQHRKEFSDLHFPPNIIRVIRLKTMRCADLCLGRKEMDGVLVGKYRGKRPLERRNCKRQGNIKVDLKEI